MTFRFLDREPLKKILLLDSQELVDHATAQALAAMVGAGNAYDVTEEQLMSYISGDPNELDFETVERIRDALGEIADDYPDGTTVRM